MKNENQKKRQRELMILKRQNPVYREKCRLYSKMYRRRPNFKKHNKEYKLKYYWENDVYRNKQNERRRKQSKELLLLSKQIVLEHYGRKCSCCGETHNEFLTVDHINGGGRQHRINENIWSMWIWLVKNNFPEGYQILCMNCNFANGKFGYCPHKLDF